MPIDERKTRAPFAGNYPRIRRNNSFKIHGARSPQTHARPARAGTFFRKCIRESNPSAPTRTRAHSTRTRVVHWEQKTRGVERRKGEPGARGIGGGGGGTRVNYRLGREREGERARERGILLFCCFSTRRKEMSEQTRHATPNLLISIHILWLLISLLLHSRLSSLAPFYTLLPSLFPLSLTRPCACLPRLFLTLRARLLFLATPRPSPPLLSLRLAF